MSVFAWADGNAGWCDYVGLNVWSEFGLRQVGIIRKNSKTKNTFLKKGTLTKTDFSNKTNYLSHLSVATSLLAGS